MPELKDHVSLDHISLELEQPFWAWARWEGRGGTEGWEEKRKDEKWEVRRKKKESPESLLPMRFWMLLKAPLLSWATLSGFLFCETKRSLTRTACFGPFGLVVGAQRTVDQSCQEAHVPAWVGGSSFCMHTLTGPHATVWIWHLFMLKMEAPRLSPKYPTQKQGRAPCLKRTRNYMKPNWESI